ncbi:MAG: bifunctional adenosylcobinamide kinase/adenosylcobinamide-phosphate guanylyltransferase [Acidimicrobiales bacterium]
MAITLVLGGARSGKSQVAEALAGDEVIYVATAEVGDDDFAARVARHRERRPAAWSTVESGPDLPATIRSLPDRPALVDSLGTWVARCDGFAADAGSLVAALQERASPTIVVSEEVGLGVHPETEVGRRWRDAIGEVNQEVAAVAEAVLLVVAGRTLRL